jgi:RimJ/RimL family protein N-acetyltransferase
MKRLMEKEIRLTNGMVTLRPYRMSDIDHMYEAVRESIPELSAWMPWCHADYSVEESRSWVGERAEKWEQGTEYSFAVTDYSAGIYLGGCGLNDIHRGIGIANLGYWVRTSQTKKGVGTAATLLLAKFAFSELKLNRLELVVAVSNTASSRVAEKAGATKEGVYNLTMINMERFIG